MNREPKNYKALLQELIDKDVSLEAAANILWQWKRWEDAKAERDHANSRGANPDAVGYLHQASERNRLQLEHYLVVANISEELVTAIVRPAKH